MPEPSSTTSTTPTTLLRSTPTPPRCDRRPMPGRSPPPLKTPVPSCASSTSVETPVHSRSDCAIRAFQRQPRPIFNFQRDAAGHLRSHYLLRGNGTRSPRPGRRRYDGSPLEGARCDPVLYSLQPASVEKTGRISLCSPQSLAHIFAPHGLKVASSLRTSTSPTGRFPSSPPT
jgi:hypothetical protein